MESLEEDEIMYDFDVLFEGNDLLVPEKPVQEPKRKKQKRKISEARTSVAVKSLVPASPRRGHFKSPLSRIRPWSTLTIYQ